MLLVDSSVGQRSSVRRTSKHLREIGDYVDINAMIRRWARIRPQKPPDSTGNSTLIRNPAVEPRLSSPSADRLADNDLRPISDVLQDQKEWLSQ